MAAIYKMWVLHSPYPNGTWRGLEKCAGEYKSDLVDPLMLFDSWQKAQAFKQCYGMKHHTPVLVRLVVPDVGGELEEDSE